MRRILLALLVVVFTCYPTTSTSLVTEINDDMFAEFMQSILERLSLEATSFDDQLAKHTAWNMLCFELREVDCGGIKAPIVMLFETNPLRPGLAGRYGGGNIIYIRDNLKGKQRLEVLAHEMSHYLDNEFGLLPPMPVYSDNPEGVLALCYSEKRAWEVSDNFQLKFGNPNMVVGDRWADWYAHCTEYKDIMYPEGA